MGGRDGLEHRIAAFAATHHAIATHAELRALGLGVKAIEYRLAIGRLHRMYRGVYAIGHPLLAREGRWRAAVLAGGSRAVLSHADAAALWGLMPARGRLIDVTTPVRSGRAPDPARIRIHRVGTLRPWECAITDEIPVATVARTLLDLSPSLHPRAMEELVAQADRLGLFDLVALRRCLDEHPHQHGAPALRRLLDALRGTGAADLRSHLELLLLQLCDDHQLPTPVANAQVEGFLVDFLWPRARLIVETDGYAYHATRAAFERDRERDQQLTLAGYIVLRLTHRQITTRAATVADRIRHLLA